MQIASLVTTGNALREKSLYKNDVLRIGDPEEKNDQKKKKKLKELTHSVPRVPKY